MCSFLPKTIEIYQDPFWGRTSYLFQKDWLEMSLVMEEAFQYPKKRCSLCSVVVVVVLFPY
jgi:hypothetical protein